MWAWLISHPIELLVFFAVCMLFGIICDRVLKHKIRKDSAQEELEEAEEKRKRSSGQGV